MPLACILCACSTTPLGSLSARCSDDSDCTSGFCIATPTNGDLAGLRPQRCALPDADPDADGLQSFAERLAGSDAFDADSDHDGLDDGAEWGPNVNQARDRDGDGKPDLIEADDADRDGDCLGDADDFDDDAVASPAALAAAHCTVGVCKTSATAATCVQGVVTCLLPATSPYEPAGESSCDGLDNDCDGQTDEELDGKAGPGCGVVGVCIGAKKSRCVAGQWLCNLALLPEYQPIEKACDGLDNDCDGQTDESPICDDGVACTVDACDATTGCRHAPDTGPCFDGNECTVDICDVQNGCAALPRIGVCDDDNPCTQGESCVGGACKGGSPSSCEDGSNCTANPCDPQLGCLSLPVAAGSACKPTDPCQQVGLCDQGKCLATTAVDCSDGNPCSVDSCDPSDGDCVHTAIEGPCNDGSSCTSGDACDGLHCQGVALPSCCSAVDDCDDNNPCSQDVCNAGSCSYATANSNGINCEDNNFCTKTSVCASGICVPTALSSCDDSNPCTVDACDPSLGCTAQPLGNDANCDDGNVCNGVALCKAGSCVGGAPLGCDDSNPCTNDGCDASTGCKHSPNTASCSDGNPCTRQDLCALGACSGIALVCNDDKACTIDSCDLSTGCVYGVGTGPCDDGDACTDKDSCAKGACSGVAMACTDGSACTTDSCDNTKGCIHNSEALEGHACDDGDACTGGDRCAQGSCTFTQTVGCDDKNSCTESSCSATTGRCQQPTVTGACVTATGCAADATCTFGVCVGTPIANCCDTSIDCQDQNPCTLDSCDKSNGSCKHQTLSSLTCSDGNACTLSDACVAGLCRGGAALACDDGNACTEDFCAPSKGCLALARPFASCGDGNPCNGGELCTSDICSAGATLDCDDGEICTIDSCNGSSGCKHVAATNEPCDDASSCTDNDACTKAGTCTGSPTASAACCMSDVDCDDGYACTIDHCDGAKGTCSHTARVCSEVGGCDVRACLEGSCVSQSRCGTPTVHRSPIEGSSTPPGWRLTTSAGDATGGWAADGWVAGAIGSGLAPSSTRSLRVALGKVDAAAALPTMHLGIGTYRLRFWSRVDADGGCSGAKLQARRNGVAFGPNLCATALPLAVELPFELTVSGDVALDFRFVGAENLDTKRGAWLDDVEVIAPAGTSCGCKPK